MTVHVSAEQTRQPAPAPTSLGRLCSATTDVFHREVWSVQPWLSRATDLHGHVEEIFSAQAVDELLSRRGLRTPFVRLAKNGRVVPSSRFTGSGGAGATIADQIMDDAVLQQFADGTTVVLQAVHRTWPEVGELAAGLADELGHPVQVNAYITPPQSKGFAAHYDTHDVFVLQIAGHKRWQVHEPVFTAPLPENPWESVADQVSARAQEAPVIEEVMEPGDSLYLPRGFIHSAEALGGTSVHLTFGVHPVVERDVVRTAMKALETSGWRDSLSAGWDPTTPAGVAQVEDIITRLQSALSALDLDAVTTALHDQRAAMQRPAPIAPIAQAGAAATLTSDDVLLLRKHLTTRIQAMPDAGAILVLPGGRRLTIPADQTAALDVILTGSPIAVSALPLAPETALELSRRLLVAGVVTME